MSGAGAILRLATIPRLRTRSPLSRRAGEGPGVRDAHAAGEEGGRRVAGTKAWWHSSRNGRTGTGRTQ